MRIAGIDGCKRGWVVVHCPHDDLAAAEVSFTADLNSFMTAAQIDFAVVDIPIGFTSGPSDRDVEPSMRAMLKGKSSSVFNTPCREALDQDSYHGASEVNRKTLGKGMSKQTHAIFPKMREMDRIVRELGQNKIREGHPEVTFAVLNGSPVHTRKKDSAGADARASLLVCEGFNIAELASTVRHLDAAKDDILDAAALLWTAKRFVEKKHITLPPVPARDAVGIEMSVIA
jgi:predicted RNase H-like nuclease